MSDPYGKSTQPGGGTFQPGYRPINGTDLNSALGKIFQGRLSRQDTITAHAGGTQAAAFQLTKSLNRVSVAVTAADSVALPKAIAGSMVYVMNSGASSIQVFGKVGTTDTINGIAFGTGIAQANGKMAAYICWTSGAWFQMLSA